MMHGSYASHTNFDHNQGFSSSSPSKEPADFRVSHSNVSEDFRVNYTEFDFLPDYPAGTNMNEVIDLINFNFNSSDWLDHFNAIDNLRILGKYHAENMNGIFDYFGRQIENSLNSSKSCIAKNALIFVNETFQHAKRSQLQTVIVLFLLPKLISKASGISKTLKPLADAALTGMVQNCISNELLVALCETTCNNSNQSFSETAFHYITRALEILKADLSNVERETLRTLFLCFAHIFEGPSATNKTLCRRVTEYVKNIMGGEAYGIYVNQLFAAGAINRRQGQMLYKCLDTDDKVRPSLANELKGTNSRKSCANKDTLYLEIDNLRYHF